MNGKVIKEFIDGNTGETVPVGSIYNCSESEFEKLVIYGLLENPNYIHEGIE